MIETTAIIAVIVGLSETCKAIGMPVKWIPALNICLGILAMGFFGGDTIAANVFYGIVTGLSAGGLYSGVKNIAQTVTKG